ncbi:response regulator transcription factor [Cohnella soli]|uniref:Response regulator n=1 Tax=Cohnella soli TaxID=425005 RepID=A0ABW0I1D1_9BACL
MYRMLIVDDEPIIVNGLIQMFQDHSEFELDICKAYSASEALEIAKRTKLDILVSDIRMPSKTGLQLVDEISYYWPACRVIFLTGYNEFDYVYEAIRKNADSYILKTEGMDPIFEAVKRAILKLEEENNRRLEQERAQLHLQIADPYLKMELLSAMLDGGQSLVSLLASERYADLDIAIDLARPAYLVAGVANGADAPKRKTLQSVQRIFEQLLPESLACEHTIYEDVVPVWLLQPSEELFARFVDRDTVRNAAGSGVVAYLKGVLEQIQNECEAALEVSVAFGISGNLSDRWETVPQRMTAMLAGIRDKVRLGNKLAIVDFSKSAGTEPVADSGASKEEGEQRQWLIEQINQYVHDHLAGDLSLTTISSEFHFNPSYLSRYYKQATGRNLLEFIQATKLNAAIDLMLHTPLKLNEIADRTGFDSNSYFTTFFKKMTGMSPQQYRNARR